MDDCKPEMPARILWIGRLYPAFPLDGAALHSSGLLRACGELGARVSAICLNPIVGRKPPPVSWPGIDWTVIDAPPRARALRALHWLPAGAVGFRAWKYKRALERLLRQQDWNAVIIDSLSLGDYVRTVRRLAKSNPAVLFVAHNHEASTRLDMVWQTRIPFWLRMVLLQDGWKARRLERSVAGASDIVLAITKADADKFRAEAPGKRIEVLAPGYDGEKATSRDLKDSEMRVLALGSYEWVFKQINLEAFLAASSAPFSRAGIVMRVAGKMSDAYREKLARRFPRVEFAGSVTDPREHLQAARIGVVIDRLGGGFKLKVLDYAFARLPIAALRPAMRDGLLKPGEHYLAADTIGGLIDAILAAFDDTQELTAMADRAARTVERSFDWHDRGRRLLGIVAELQAQRPTMPSQRADEYGARDFGKP